MKEIEKLKRGLEYCFLDEEVANLKQEALIKCARFNNIDPTDDQKQQVAIKDLFGSTGATEFEVDHGRTKEEMANSGFLTPEDVGQALLSVCAKSSLSNCRVEISG